MRRFLVTLSVVAITALVRVDVAEACGGFFCGRVPVDQTAERIVFRVNEDSVTMIVQIAYTGDAPDFAWVLPLGEVPDVESLGVFPQRALTALDAQTGPQFILPEECIQFRALSGACPNCGGVAVAETAVDDASAVTVHYRAEVGPYDVAAIESEDPMALYDWLLDNEFNVNEVMLPYIESYTNEGMKFIALKLQHDQDSSDIQPFRFDLPGTSPSVPLRMTALAAEPEMSIVAFVFGQERYNGANWPEVQIRDEQIVWRQDTWPLTTNWAALVARGVDAAGGEGWVTDLASPTTSIVQLLQNSSFNTPEDEEAGMELLDLIGDTPYLTRLYTRMSAEEMHSDPIFRRDTGGDVSNMHMLSREVDGVDLCPDVPISPDPCLFTSCGAGGICRPVLLDGMDAPVAGCGCVGGATARTTLDPASVSLQADGSTAPAAAVICQDARMSFVNPGDETAGGATMEDPCATFDCGAGGECISVNMTPTCICDQGFVGIGSFKADGGRTTRCEQPMEPVPDAFYQQRLPDLPEELPGGREMVNIDMSLPVVEPSMDDLGSDGMPVPRVDESSDDPDGSGSNQGVEETGANEGQGTVQLGEGEVGGTDGTPVDDEGMPSVGGSNSNGGCTVRAPGGASAGRATALGLCLLALGWLRRRTC